MSVFHVSTAAVTVSFSFQVGISASLKAHAFALEMNDIPTLERRNDGVVVSFQVKSAPTVSWRLAAFLLLPPMVGVVEFSALNA